MSGPDTHADTATPAVSQLYQPRLFAIDGRIGRLRYLAYGTVMNLALLLGVYLLAVSLKMMASGHPAESGWQESVWDVILIAHYAGIASLAVVFAKRRLNDLNKPGWLVLLVFVPLLNLLLLIYLVFFKGTEGSNNYGLAPVPNTIGVAILGLFLPIAILIGLLGFIVPSYYSALEKAKQQQIELLERSS